MAWHGIARHGKYIFRPNEEGANKARGTRRDRPVPLLVRLFPPIGTLVSRTFDHLHNFAMVDSLSALLLFLASPTADAKK
jgi:hypothetical protein